MSTWDEAQHPRQRSGEFAEKPGSTPETSLAEPRSDAAYIAHARATDEQIAAEYEKYWQASDQARAAEIETERQQEKLERYTAKGWPVEDLPEKIDRLGARAEELRAEADTKWLHAHNMDAQLYEGWPRFFLVEHIHNRSDCPSFKPSTHVHWLPSVSGLSEKDAVTEYGATLCTKCFPSAPVELITPKSDPAVCAGSGQPVDLSRPTGREDAYYSPSGRCSVCGVEVALTSRGSGRARKHKTA